MNQLQTLIDVRRTSFRGGTMAEDWGQNYALEISNPPPIKSGFQGQIRWYSATVTVNLLPLLPSLVERIKAILVSGNIKEAQRLTAQALEESPGDVPLQRLSRLIAPPQLLAMRPAHNVAHLEANRRWIRDSGNEHRGQWVAVRDGHLLGAAPTVAELRAQVGDTKDALVTKIA